MKKTFSLDSPFFTPKQMLSNKKGNSYFVSIQLNLNKIINSQNENIYIQDIR